MTYSSYYKVRVTSTYKIWKPFFFTEDKISPYLKHDNLTYFQVHLKFLITMNIMISFWRLIRIICKNQYRSTCICIKNTVCFVDVYASSYSINILHKLWYHLHIFFRYCKHKSSFYIIFSYQKFFNIYFS